MNPNKTCCPPPKIYDNATGKCRDLNMLNPTDPIDCPCCPSGYSWDDVKQGCYTLIGSGPTSDIPCPCCPDGYYYYSPTANCINILTPNSQRLEPIPCITCNCVVVEPPECPTCGTDGLPIAYTYSGTIKNCTECTPEDLEQTKNGCFNKFLPIQFISPLINFTLRNKNFI